MNATYLSKDQNWQNGSTTYWFDVDGEEYGVVEGENAGIVDFQGFPVDVDAYSNRHISGLASLVTDEMRMDY